jgi:WD40 repeat protein
MRNLLVFLLICFVLQLHAQKEKIKVSIGNTADITKIEMSKDASVIMAMNRYEIVLYRSADGKEISRFDGDYFENAFLSEDSKKIVIACTANGQNIDIKVFDILSKNKLSEFKIDLYVNPLLAYFVAADYLISADKESLIIYDIIKSAEVGRIYVEDKISNFKISADKKYMAIAHEKDFQVKVYDIKSRKLIRKYKLDDREILECSQKEGLGIYNDYSSVELAFENQLLVKNYCSKDDSYIESVILYDPLSGKEVEIDRNNGKGAYLNGLSISPDGEILIQFSQELGLTLNSVLGGREIFNMRFDSVENCTNYKFSKDNKFFFISFYRFEGFDLIYKTKIFNAQNMELIRELKGEAYSYDEKTSLLVYAEEGNIRICDMNDFAITKQIDAKTIALMYAVQSHDGNSFAACYFDNSIIVFDANTHKERFRIKAEKKIDNIQFSYDNKKMLYCQDSLIQIFDAENGKLISKIALNKVPSKTFFTSGGRLVYCFDEMNQFCLFDYSNNREIFKKNDVKKYNLANSDSILIVSNTEANLTEIYNVFSDELVTSRVDIPTDKTCLLNYQANDLIYPFENKLHAMSIKNGKSRELEIVLNEKNTVMSKDKKYLMSLVHGENENHSIVAVYAKDYKPAFTIDIEVDSLNDLKYFFNTVLVNEAKNQLVYNRYISRNDSILYNKLLIYDILENKIIDSINVENKNYKGFAISENSRYLIIKYSTFNVQYDLESRNSVGLDIPTISSDLYISNKSIIKNGFDKLTFYKIENPAEYRSFIRFKDGTEFYYDDYNIYELKGKLDDKLYSAAELDQSIGPGIVEIMSKKQ